MLFKHYYLGCLSHASYLVGDSTSGRAVVVDPQRDIQQYLGNAAQHGLSIERVIETHFHADFLSGHLELAAATGAVISYGTAATGQVEFAMEPLAHGQRLNLGTVELERSRELSPTRPTVVYCAGGYRSSVAASLLRSLGFSDVSDLIGGFGAWSTAGLGR